jgi:enamine deaminase RidA (YjgF/YER057c/UK114 family)
MLAGEPLPIHSGRRSREIIQILWPAEQTLVARASCEKDRADIDAGGLVTAAGLAMMAAVALLGFSGGQASAQQIVERFPSSGSAPASIVESMRVPPGAEMLILSGQTASRADAPDRSVSIDLPPAALGDTKTQTINILNKIRAALGRRGYALADVVKLTVYLVGDPANGAPAPIIWRR